MIDFKKKMEELEKKEKREIFQEEEIFENSEKKKKKKRITIFITSIIVIVLIFSGQVIMSSQSTVDWLSERGIFNTLSHLVPSGDKKLEGEKQDRVNILLMGMGGSGHDGAYLADTMIVASLKPSTKEVSLVSIPRDLTVPIDGAGWRKINHINALAEAKNEGSGGKETIKALSEIFQIPINYYVRVDFQGFINMIDEIGGIEVDVENTLDDYKYPIFGEEDNPDYYARFEHLHIEEGLQKMDGELALKYARSRHAYGIEGSDFARAKRQQKVIEAAKEKLLSRQTLLNPITISKLINQFNEHLSTNLETWELIRLWNLSKDVKKSDINNKVLSDAPDNYLKSSISEAGAYILLPKTGNFGEIRNMFQNVFKSSEESNDDNDNENIEGNLIVEDEATVSIMNATWITGLASKTATALEDYKYFEIENISNAPNRDREKSVIFDLTYGDKNEALNSLEKIINIKQSFDFPEWVKEYQDQEISTDFLILLGTDYNIAE
jgi:LCP family protein required for cell wall assembly